MGVEKKLASRARAVSHLGLDMDFFYFNDEYFLQDKEVKFYRREGRDRNKVLSSLQRYSCISKYVDADQYDLLVLRYSGGDFSLLSEFFRKNGGKIVTEHQAKEVPEAWTYETTLLQKMINVGMEEVIGPKMIRKCAGLIANCDDVRTYELERARCKIPSTIVADGVSVEAVPPTGYAPYTGKKLNLLCIAASFDPWQGLDRVLKGLSRYAKRQPSVHLVVVGDVSAENHHLKNLLAGKENVDVTFLGKLYGSRLEEVFQSTHLAFSPLAMFRKQIAGGSSLKTREYLARGLPFVIGHEDPDLHGANKYFLSVPPDESPVDMDQVVEFAGRVLKKKEISLDMREFAEQRVDWKVKMQHMWDFLMSIPKGHSSGNS
jgi:glycosyltransferase involved in cell wall biosynthesis